MGARRSPVLVALVVAVAAGCGSGPRASAPAATSTGTVTTTALPTTSMTVVSTSVAPAGSIRPVPTTTVTTALVPGADAVAPAGALEPVRLTAAGWVRTTEPATHSTWGASGEREEIFRRAGLGLGDPGLLVRTTTGGCEPGMAVDGLQGVDPAIVVLDSWITAKHCIGDVTVEVVGDRVDRAVIEQVVGSVTVDATGRVTSLGDAAGAYASVGARQRVADRSWTATYRSGAGGPTLDLTFGNEIEPGWSLELDRAFFIEPRRQEVVDVNGHRAVVLDSDSGTEVISWFESPYLLVRLYGVLERDELLAAARSVVVLAGSDPLFGWPGAGADGFVPQHLPDPSAYAAGGYAASPDGDAICRYREVGAFGGHLPYCTPLDRVGYEYIAGYLGQPLLVRVPASAARLVDAESGGEAAHRDTGILAPDGERLWEVADDGSGYARTYRALDANGATVRCVSAVTPTC